MHPPSVNVHPSQIIDMYQASISVYAKNIEIWFNVSVAALSWTPNCVGLVDAVPDPGELLPSDHVSEALTPFPTRAWSALHCTVVDRHQRGR